MARVKLEELRKVYDSATVAVHGASFEVADGEFVVLLLLVLSRYLTSGLTLGAVRG